MGKGQLPFPVLDAATHSKRCCLGQILSHKEVGNGCQHSHIGRRYHFA